MCDMWKCGIIVFQSHSKNSDLNGSRSWFEKFKRLVYSYTMLLGRRICEIGQVWSRKSYIQISRLRREWMINPQQIFTCDEVDLFCMKMRKKTHLHKIKKHWENINMNYSIAPLLFVNSISDWKVKSLVMYHSEIPNFFQIQCG